MLIAVCPMHHLIMDSTIWGIIYYIMRIKIHTPLMDSFLRKKCVSYTFNYLRYYKGVDTLLLCTQFMSVDKWYFEFIS